MFGKRHNRRQPLLEILRRLPRPVLGQLTRCLLDTLCCLRDLLVDRRELFLWIVVGDRVLQIEHLIAYLRTISL